MKTETAERLRRKLSLRKAAKILAEHKTDFVSFASKAHTYSVKNEMHTCVDPLSIVTRELGVDVDPDMQLAALEVVVRRATLDALYPDSDTVCNHYDVHDAVFTALGTAARLPNITDVFHREGDVLVFVGRVRFARPRACPPAVAVQMRLAASCVQGQRHFVSYAWGAHQWRGAVIDTALPLSRRGVNVHAFNADNFISFERLDHLPVRLMKRAEVYQSKIRNTYLGLEPVVNLEDTFDAAPLVGKSAREVLENRAAFVTSTYLLAQ